TGIMLNEIGPFEYAPELWQFSYIPVPTDLCDGCVDRVASGKLPTCVHHCQAKCMEYGPISSLAKKLEEKSKQVLYSL
ncbi:MAG: 4Fe-4S dicluster domain-containing protein, partial [Raoultibacter sp.]